MIGWLAGITDGRLRQYGYCRLKINFTVSINGAGTSMISATIYSAIATNGTAKTPKRFLLKATNKQSPESTRNTYKMTNDLLLRQQIFLCLKLMRKIVTILLIFKEKIVHKIKKTLLYPTYELADPQ
ncbi:hypothetical protein CD33_03115 [Ureibacillus sinduriensis BLB-1 = JCM 15800]|uniref:Uncharacterized protein n=1 Tax=Ureibacillus sinduriensis BLB-1 = JCM 15800 TaxID=1384057 RepID=A0A0A3HXJ7_9BACL|nr:hypothetical protein CD33_03115 [Ureibacillus sinduriensis BLB-1 = JCM 15800]